MVRVRSFPRIHLGLFDLGHTTRRDHGGSGFYVDGLPVEIEVVRSRKMQIAGMTQLDKEGRNDLRSAIDRLRKFCGLPNVSIRLRNLIPQHVGLGSKTALVLGVLKAADLALGLNLGRDVLQKLSGRGGTSGIGVNAFFSGGFLADCGHPTSKTSRFAPSSRRSEFVIPPVTCRLGIPGDWRFHMILLAGRRLTSRTEMNFFRQNTPIPDAEVLSSMAAVYHGVIPAVLSGDLKLLKEALRDVRSTGFKARELLNQADPVKDFIRDADDRTGLALGMSSLGPLIFAIGTEKDEKDSAIVKELILRYRGVMLGVFRGRNHGYEAAR